MASLSGQNIKDTFQKIVQVDDGGRLQNGIGGDLGQVTLTGSIAASSGFVGDLQGNAETSTLATTATTASHANTASLAQTASTALFAATASLAQTATTASYTVTSSYTTTASYAVVSNNTTQFAGKNVAQFVTTGSVDTRQTVSGSLQVTQNLDVLGTASFAYVTASQTVVDQNTISVYASGSILPTAGYVVVDTASVYSGSSFLYNVVDEIWTLDRPLSASLQGTASYALTASNLSTLATASYALTASYTITSSNALTASYLDPYATASYALTASYLDTSYIATASMSGSYLVFEKGDGTTYDILIPEGGASGSNRVFEFNSPSTQWDMAHNFEQQHVSVTLYNSNHLQIGASQISASDANNVSAYFTYPVSGYAMVLAAGGSTTVSGSNIETGSLATTGSNVFIGNQYVTGSVDITGSLFLNGVSLAPGTVTSASFASTASYSVTASYIETVNYALTASYLSGSIASSSYAATASYVLGSIESASYATVANSLNTLNQTVNISGSVSLTGNVNNVPITTGKDNINGNFAIGTDLPNIDASGGGDAAQYNIAIGEGSLSSNTSGNYNVAINRALVSNTTGVWNTAVGYNTMFFGSNVSRNVTLGMWTLTGIDNSSDNVAVGTEAGRYIASGNLNAASASIFIGDAARAKANNSVNEIVIGARAVGSGSNTTTIGNNNTTHTYLKGTVSATSFTGSFTGPLTGTASFAATASYVAKRWLNLGLTSGLVGYGSSSMVTWDSAQSSSNGIGVSNLDITVPAGVWKVDGVIGTDNYSDTGSGYGNFSVVTASNNVAIAGISVANPGPPTVTYNFGQVPSITGIMQLTQPTVMRLRVTAGNGTFNVNIGTRLVITEI